MRFESSRFGEQQLTNEDRQYTGSRYSEIREALLRNAYYLEWRGPGQLALPVYEVTLGRLLAGVLRRWRHWRFLSAAERTLEARADMRWGTDRLGWRRLLHPNGICLLGKWTIDQPSDYTGYFQQGSQGLIVGRYSTCCTECRRGFYRSLSLVGKIFPTTDPEHCEPLITANFITQEDLGGMRTDFINDALLRNVPDTTPWRRGWGLPILLVTGLAFKLLDREPTIRQLYQIAELDKPPSMRTRTPRCMQLKVQSEQLRVEGHQLDFRDEILSHFYSPNHDETTGPRKLVFDIEVTDQVKTQGLLAQRRQFPDGWRRIGSIEFTEAVASYNGDFVIHFQHPPWRHDPDDPDSTVRTRRVDRNVKQ